MVFRRKLTGRDPADLYGRGLAAYSRGDFAGAIRDFSRVVELEPDLPPAYYQRGLAYGRSGRVAEAAADFEKAAELGRSVIVGSAAQAEEQQVRAEYNCGLA